MTTPLQLSPSVAPAPAIDHARLRALRGAPLVIKYGGAVLEDAALADAWAADLARLIALGLEVVVVHGGGHALTRTLERLGIESRFVAGHRVTSAEAAEVAEMVLSGRMNKEVVGRLVRAGVPAIGLSGTDGGLLTVKPLRPLGHDVGFVGEVERVNPGPLRHLLAGGLVPVVSSTAAGPDGQPFNLNADVVAGAVAAALGSRLLLFLSDVPGVLVDGVLAHALTPESAAELVRSGTAAGGMRPKIEAALHALEGGVGEVRLGDGRIAGAALREVLAPTTSGTRIALTPPADGPGSSPGPQAPDWAGSLAARGAAAVMSTYSRYPIELVSGRGARVVDANGRSYLDFVAGIAVSALGHGHPAVVAAIREAATGLLHVSNLYWTEPMVRLAERLTAAAGMDRAFFCNSGAEAVEAALKLARRARPGRPKVVAFERSFHGRTLGALSVTAQEHYQAPFRPLLAGVEVIPFGDVAAASAAIDDTIAAVLVEPIQGEGGVRPAPAGFLAALRARCDATGALLLLDEVQTGLGRTGTLFAFQQEGIVPDALATAKALAGGLPMGALLARGEAATALGPGDHASTFGGGPFVATVANAVLDVVLGDGFLDRVRESADHLTVSLHRLALRHPARVREVRGRGLLRGIVLDGPHAPELVAILHELGLLTVPAGKDVLRLLPPLTVTRGEIDEAVALLDHGLSRLGVH